MDLNALPSCPLICLSICLSCVWPCPSLPLQEVVSRLIERRLRSLELNTCSEELLFNCSSHTLTLAGCSHVHIKHIDTVWSSRSHSLVLALSFFSRKKRDEWEKGKVRDKWLASRRSVHPETGRGRRDGATIICMLCCRQVKLRFMCGGLWACLDQSTASRLAIQSFFWLGKVVTY